MSVSTLVSRVVTLDALALAGDLRDGCDRYIEGVYLSSLLCGIQTQRNRDLIESE
jgi:hypothetical protein